MAQAKQENKSENKFLYLISPFILYFHSGI